MRPAYLEAARQMGEAIARRSMEIVYGAGSTGMMGAVADGALEAGGRVTGVIPALFATPQLMHNGLSRLEIVDSMHTRKARLAELADTFIALPGGFGTFEELFEMLTWAQIGLHRKPVGLLNTLDYFVPLLRMVEHAREEGFLYEEHACLLSHAAGPDELLDALEGFNYPGGMERWLTREE
jgi:uncharacterized protein (TIGR00730 family)